MAVAAGLLPLAIGTDTAGPLRIPGQCCGVAAWEPTFGLVPTDGADPALRARLTKGLAIPAAALEESRVALRRLAGDPLEALFAGADALMLPMMCMPIPRVDVCEPGSPEFSARTLYALSALTGWVNGLGLPAVAIVTGWDEAGLQVSMQLVGRPGADRALLDLALTLENRGSDGLFAGSAMMQGKFGHMITAGDLP